MSQTVSNACYDRECDDCGLHAPDGRACRCACHATSALWCDQETAARAKREQEQELNNEVVESLIVARRAQRSRKQAE